MSEQFDVVVIGGGPGGYIAAIRAAQLGLRTACVDDWKSPEGKPALGGTCTNVGCIPSKALLQSSEHLEHARRHLAEHGISVEKVSLDLARMLARKNRVVKQNGDGIAHLFKKNGVYFAHGRAQFVRATPEGYELSVRGGPRETLVAKHVIVATGSSPRALPEVPFDEERVLSNTGALALSEVPETLGVIGAGVVGLELGSVWRRLGAQVTVLEAMPTFLGAVDEDIAKLAFRALSKQGLAMPRGVQVRSVERGGDGVQVTYVDSGGNEQVLACERLIVSVGRVPNTRGLEPGAVGLALDERGFVAVDAHCRSNLTNVWAIGDVVRGPMLAHKAEEEGAAVAERIAGQKPEVDFNTVPWVIYTSPEVAWVGQTEQQLRAAGRAYNVGKCPFLANARARAAGDTTGMVKILADAKTDEVLGVHIVGPNASELIGQGVLVMEFRGLAEDIARTCHAHPTLSEAMKEAALAVHKRALNL